MGKFFNHEYWAENVAKIYKVLSKVAFFLVLISGYILAALYLISALHYSGAMSLIPLIFAIIVALITPFLAGLASITPLVTATILDKLTRNEENTRFLLIDFFESRYKKGEITEEELKKRFDIINNR